MKNFIKTSMGVLQWTCGFVIGVPGLACAMIGKIVGDVGVGLMEISSAVLRAGDKPSRPVNNGADIIKEIEAM